jgi:hypothetical protein
MKSKGGIMYNTDKRCKQIEKTGRRMYPNEKH